MCKSGAQNKKVLIWPYLKFDSILKHKVWCAKTGQSFWWLWGIKKFVIKHIHSVLGISDIAINAVYFNISHSRDGQSHGCHQEPISVGISNIGKRPFLVFALLIKITIDSSAVVYKLGVMHRKGPALWWRHNELDGVSDHQPHDCLLNRLFGRRSKKTSKLRVTGLFAGNLPGTGEFPAQKASNAENVSIWWRHHGESGMQQ